MNSLFAEEGGTTASGTRHSTKHHSTIPLEHLNKEVIRRADVVGISANEPAIMRLIGPVLLERNDERQLTQRYTRDEPLGWAIPLIVARSVDRRRDKELMRMNSLTNRTKGLLGAIGNVTFGIAAALALLVKYAPVVLAAFLPKGKMTPR